MIYYKDNKYHISNLKVVYNDNQEKYVGQEGKQWWIDFADIWKNKFKLVKFIDLKIDDEMKERLDNVNLLKIKEGVSYVYDYVINGDLDKVELGHPLYQIKLEEEITNSQLMAMNLQKQIILGGR